MKVKAGDTVAIIAGKDKGKQGEVSKVFPKKNQIIVKGMNMFKRHVKPREGIEGGIYPVERPLDVSKVALVDPKTQKPTRVGYQVMPDGKKQRITKASGSNLDNKTAPTKKTSKKAKKKS